MGRKVLTIGKSSYAITLPKEFIHEHNLQPGEEVHISHQGNQLLIQPHDEKIRVEVDLSNLGKPSEAFLLSLLRGLFLYGAQHAKLTNVNQEMKTYLQEQLEKPDTKFYVEKINDKTMYLRCPITLNGMESFDDLIRHSLQHIYKSMHEPELRQKPELPQLDFTRRILSQRVESRTHLSLYSFVEKLELIARGIAQIEETPQWMNEYAHAIYLMQQISQTHNISEINTLCNHTQKLRKINQELDTEQQRHAEPLLRYIQHASANLLIAYA